MQDAEFPKLSIAVHWMIVFPTSKFPEALPLLLNEFETKMSMQLSPEFGIGTSTYSTHQLFGLFKTLTEMETAVCNMCKY